MLPAARDALPMAFEIVMLFRHLLLSEQWKDAVTALLGRIIHAALKGNGLIL